MLTDENDTVLNNRSISFNIGDETVNVTTCNGYANLSDLKAGNYSMHCSFSGDELYYASSCEFNISVIKKNTTLTSGNLTTTSVVIKVDGKVGKYLKVTLMSGNLTLSSKDVQIKINSKTYNVKTDESGIAYLQINLAKAGTYSAEIAFLGDDEYNSSFAVSKITVKKKKMSLKVPKKTYKKSKKVKKLTATLKVNKSKAISSKKIIFKVNGKKYTAKTNKKGVANVKVKITKNKKYTVTVTFKGDSSYAKIVKKSKLIIK